MVDRLLKTLHHRLIAEEREWRSHNQLRGALYLSFWRRAILYAASRPLIYLRWLFGLALALSVGAAVVDPKHWAVFHIRDFAISDPVDNFSALWSVQAAIAALVYPIVIAFVTLLVERQSTTKAAMHIYLHDSAALLAGLSALLLVAEMGLQYSALSYVNDSALAVWLVIDAGWFALNIGLTIYFLFRTFEFMRPARRFDITRRYAISVAWPQEVRHHLARHFFRSAISEKMLPGAAYGSETGDSPSVLLGYVGLDVGVPSVSRSLGTRKRQLVDVRFRLLAWAISGWLRNANSSPSATPKKTSLAAVSGAVIAFPLDPFETYEGETILCQVKDGVAPSWLQRSLIRFSFKFAAPEKPSELSVNDILLDVQAEAIASIRSGEQGSFEDSVKRLLVLYESLLDASSVLDSKGEVANLTLLPDRNHWFERPVHEVWGRRIVDLFEAASKKLSLGEDYVSFLTHVPARLFSRGRDFAVPTIQLSIISMSPILLRHVEDWWVNTLEQQGQVLHGPCNEGTLRPPFFGVHDRVIRSFVGSWESFRDRMIPSRDDEVAWSRKRQSAVFLEAHLAHTLAMLLQCVLLGDKNAAEWLTDVLIKWHEGLRFRLDGSSHYFLRKQRLLTIDMLSDDWADVERHIQVESYGVPDTVKPHAILGACLNNLWVDTCCIALYELAIWSTNCECTNSFPASIFAFIVNGTPPRPGGDSHGQSRPYFGPDDLLLAILRQRFADAKYNNRLDGYVDRIAELSRVEMISGRVYSRSGANDLDSLDDGHLLTLLLTMPASWTPSHEVLGILEDYARTDSEKIRRFDRMLRRWKDRLEHASFSDMTKNYECLRNRSCHGLANEEAKAALLLGISQLLTTMADVKAIALSDAPVSQSKLVDIGEWSSRTAFARQTAAFPVPLFHEVTTTADGATVDPFKLIIKGVKRGELTEPPMEDIAINEADWFSETVRGYVSSSVLGVALKKLKPKTAVADTSEAYWAQVKKYAAEAIAQGLHPVLLLENPTIPDWVWNWANLRYDISVPSAPADLTVTSDKSAGIDGYQWSFNDIPVFNAPLLPGGSVLLVRESLAKIEFTQLDNGHYVTASANDVDKHPELIDLTLTWKMRMQLTLHPSIRLKYRGKSRRGRG